MADTRVVDTNVLIVASAADDGSPFRPDATPIQEAALRKRVLHWLVAFEQDPERSVVLDWDWHLCGEYRQKLTEQDYGWLVLMAKQDRNEVVWVGLTMDENGHAILPDELTVAVTDRADRKMVAAALASQDAGHACRLTNACDTDWLDCGDALGRAGLQVEHLLEEWLRAKWLSKKGSA